MKTLKLLSFLLFIVSFSLNAQQNIKVGDIYTFEDNTKGVVFYIDEEGRGLAVSLEQERRRWEEETNFVYCQDIVTIANEKDVETSLNVGLGKINTAYIIQQLGEYKAPAARYSRKNGAEWYLPSAGEMFYLVAYANLEGDINKALETAGGKKLNGWYWTSSEYNNGEAWRIAHNGKKKRCSKLATRIYVRAIRMF